MAKKKKNEIKFYRSSGQYGFLSNLYPCKVDFEDRIYDSSEHAYQCGKPNKPQIADWLSDAPLPRLCALAAHNLLPYDVLPNWAEIKLDRMERVVRAKFTQNKDIAALLIATGTAELIEESNDSYWGSGIILGDNYHGHNHLGNILMQIRTELSGTKREDIL